MSAPQPPADDAPTHDPGHAPTSDTGAHPDAASATYDFHGEKLDFDPYRFGAPEPAAAGWTPPVPHGPAGASGDGTPRPPPPGERWSPGGDAPPEVRPGEWWQGGGAPSPGSGGPGSVGPGVFPPAGYAPPPASGGDAGRPPVDFGKAPSHDDRRPHSYPAYPAPGGYPAPPQDAGKARGGNGLAVSGMVVGIVGLLLSVTSWPGIVAGLVGLGLSIGGFFRARRGAPLKGLAITGIICSVVAVVIGSIILVVYLQRIDFDCVRDAGDNFSQAQECVK